MKIDDVVEIWQTQGTDGFHMSTDEIRGRLDMMTRKTRRRAIDGYLVCATMTISFAFWMFIGMNKLQAIGAVLTIIGFIYLAWQIRANRFRELSIDASDTLQHVRNELARQRDFHWGWRFWSRMLLIVPGSFVFFAGSAQAHPEAIRMIRFETISFVVIALAAIPLNLWMARRYQKQIDALARLQEEQ